MKCPICGEEVESASKFCPKCGTPLNNEQPQENTSSETVENKEEEVKASEPVSETTEDKAPEAAPAQEAQVAAPAGEATAPAKEPLSKTKKIAIGVIAALVVVLLVCIFTSKSFGNTLRKIFLKPEKYMAYVVADNGEEAVGVATKYYKEYVLNHTNVSKTGTTNTAEIVFGKAGKAIFDDADMKALDKVTVSLETAVAKGNASAKAELSVNGKSIGDGQFVFGGDSIYFKLPGDSKFLKFDLEDMGMGNMLDYYMGEDQDTADALDSLEKVAKALPNDAKVRKLATKYVKKMVDSIDDVDRRTDTIKAGGIEQKVTVLELDNYKKTAAEMALTAAKMAVEDKELKSIVKDAFDAAKKAQPDLVEMDFDDVYDEFISELEDFIEEAEDLIDYYDDEKNAELKLFVNGKGEIVGVDVEDEKYYGVYTYYYKIAHKGKNIGIAAGIKNGKETVREITGTGTDSNGVITADFKLKGNDGMKFTVEKFDYNAFKKGHIKGALVYDGLKDIMSSYSYYLRNSGIDTDSLSKLFRGNVKFSFDVKGSSYAFGLSVTKDKDTFFTATLDGKISHNASVSVPSSGKCVTCEDSDEFMEYLEDYDYKTILSNLKKAGVDTDIVEELEDALEEAIDDLTY